MLTDLEKIGIWEEVDDRICQIESDHEEVAGESDNPELDRGDGSIAIEVDWKVSIKTTTDDPDDLRSALAERLEELANELRTR